MFTDPPSATIDRAISSCTVRSCADESSARTNTVSSLDSSKPPVRTAFVGDVALGVEPHAVSVASATAASVVLCLILTTCLVGDGYAAALGYKHEALCHLCSC